MIDLDELQRIASAATPGPWVETKYNSLFTFADGELDECIVTSDTKLADRKFIAAANPSVILDLIGIVSAATESLRKIRAGHTLTLPASFGKTIEYDLSPAMTESALREKLIELGWTPPRAAADSLPKIKEGSSTSKPDAWKYREAGGPWRVTLYEDFAVLSDPETVPLFAGCAPASQAAAQQALTDEQIAAVYSKHTNGGGYAGAIGFARAVLALAGAAPVEAAKPRQRFETWAKQNPTPYDLRESKYIANGARTYLQDRTQWAFESFCGALGLSALPAAPAPEAQ